MPLELVSKSGVEGGDSKYMRGVFQGKSINYFISNFNIYSKMEVDTPAEALPTYTLNVLDIVRSAQSLHGLKHSEYLRYR